MQTGLSSGLYPDDSDSEVGTVRACKANPVHPAQRLFLCASGLQTGLKGETEECK